MTKVLQKGDPYTCGLCGGTFLAGRGPEESLAEKVEYFGHTPMEQMAVVCDDCWAKINPDDHPEELAAAKAEDAAVAEGN